MVDPITPSTIYAAVFLEEEALAISDGAILKSTDGGETWTSMLSGPFSYFGLLVAHSTIRSTVFAFGYETGPKPAGLLKTSDGGRSWTSIYSGPVYALLIDRATPSTLCVVGGGVWRTTDGGASWRPLDVPRCTLMLALDPVTPSTLYASARTPADAIVTKLSPSGDRLIYSTYLGGDDEDYAGTIAVDAQGNAYLAGRTFSADFPAVDVLRRRTVPPRSRSSAGPPRLPPEPSERGRGFLIKLSPTGNALAYSIPVPIFGFQGNELAVGLSGNVYVRTAGGCVLRIR